MKTKKLLSFMTAASMAVSAFAGFNVLSVSAAEAVYNFSELTESSYDIKSGDVSLFDGNVILSSTASSPEAAKPLEVSASAVSPLDGSTVEFTSALKAKGEAVTVTLEAGERMIVYYCGSDSAGTAAKNLTMQITDTSTAEVVATEENAEKTAITPYTIEYTSASGGTYTAADLDVSNRTLIYAVMVTANTDYDPSATAAPATIDPNITPSPVPTAAATTDPSVPSSIEITAATGWLESAYIKWTNPREVDGYNVYVRPEGGDYTKIDDELVRYYGEYYRADALGLAAGSYQMKVVPIINGSEVTDDAKESSVMTVKAQRREGFAFDPTSENYNADGVGAYKNDGTLKDDAQVIYIDDTNKDTVTHTILVNGKETEATGLVNILATREKNNAETTPLVIRMIGQVGIPDGVNSSMYIQIKSTSNVTFEGVGDDAAAYGWSFLIRDCSNIEVRNLAVMEFYDDGISLDTDNFNCWVHNCDIFYGQNRGGDQKKGDGSLDVKSGSDYCTFSYNHFWDSGKSSLCGMKDDSYMGYHMTYYSNWFDHSDSRMPRVRGDQVHVYNNYFDGNSKYGVGACTGSSVYVEKNVFRNVKYAVLISMQGSDIAGENTGTFSSEDGGMIKMYDNLIIEGSQSHDVIAYDADTAPVEFDAYVVSDPAETVPATVTAKQFTAESGDGTYSNFDTAADMYEYTALSTDEVVSDVETYAGRIENGDFEYEFDDSVDDEDSDRNEVLGAALEAYTTAMLTSYTSEADYPATTGEATATTAPASTATAAPAATATTAPTVAPTSAPTAAPTATATAVPTPAPGNLIRIIVTYDSNGVLEKADIAEISESEIDSYEPTAGTGVFYWESLESMKPYTAAWTDPTTPPVAEEEDPTVTVGESGYMWNADDMTLGTYTSDYVFEGLTMGAGEGVDENGKQTETIVVDTSNATIDGTKYTQRAKTGGTGDPTTGIRCFSFVPDVDCSVTLAATSSSSGATRTVEIMQGGAVLATLSVLDKAAYSADGIKAGQRVYIYSTEGGLNVYSITLIPAGYVEPTKTTWTMSDEYSLCEEGTELMQGLVTLFTDVKGNGKYLIGDVNGSLSDGVVTGSALKYTAFEDGTLSVTVEQINADKTVYIVPEGGKVDDAVASYYNDTGEKTTTVISASVTAGTVYYIYGAGTKVGFSAAEFVAE